MADIFHDFPVNAPPDRVFDLVTTPGGLDQWWTASSRGTPGPGAEYELGFGPGYLWRARMVRCERPRVVVYELTESDGDWNGSRVGFELTPAGAGTQVCFRHTGWPESNAHYRTSTYCWAMYLRILKRHLEFGETVPYDRRIDV